MYISSICVVEILYKGMLSCISSQVIQWLHVDSLKMESPMLYNAIISFLDLKCFYFPFIQTYFLSLPFLLCIFPLWSDKCFFAKELREKKNLYVLFFLGEFSHSKNHCWGYVSLLTLWVFFMSVIGCTDPSRVL